MLLNSTQRSRRSQRTYYMEGSLLIYRIIFQAFSDIILYWREMDSFTGKRLQYGNCKIPNALLGLNNGEQRRTTVDDIIGIRKTMEIGVRKPLLQAMPLKNVDNLKSRDFLWTLLTSFLSLPQSLSTPDLTSKNMGLWSETLRL